MNLFSGNVKQLGIISVILIIVILYSLFFYFQNFTENNIRSRLFDQQKQHQLESTKAISAHIGSDLDSVIARLAGLANSAYLQNAQVSSNKTQELVQENYLQINTIIDRIFVLDKNSTVTIGLIPTGQKAFIGSNVSDLNWVTETKTERKPVFSNGYVGLDGKYRIAVRLSYNKQGNRKVHRIGRSSNTYRRLLCPLWKYS